MRCLVVVVLASACGGAVPLQASPGVAYPRGPHVVDNSSPCRVSVLEHATNTPVICDYINRR